jgi:heme exporter protein A
MNALEAEGITKAYGHFRALRGVSFDVPKGEFVALFGKNGAGKTTFLKIAATLARPSTGRLRIEGLDINEEPERARKQIGFLSHSTSVYRDLTPIENLRFFSRLYGLKHSEDYILALIKRVGLERRKNDPVRAFSRGLHQRVGLARVMLHQPALLLLDEPYTGLDASAVEILNGMLDEIVADGRTVILTTHDMELGLRAATTVHIIDRGRIVYSAPRSDPGVREAYARHIRAGAAT